MKLEFESALNDQYAEDKVNEAIKALNVKRRERIFLLLKYIKDQGKFYTF